MRERNHFDGRAHRYKAFCICSVCTTETQRRLSQFWTHITKQEREEMLAQLTEKKHYP